MEKYENLYLLGTSHIAIQSIKEVSNTIKTEKPDIICLELDLRRLKALFEKEHKIKLTDIRRLGVKTFLIYYVAHQVEQKLGNIVRTKPGTERKMAAVLAREYKIPLKLIDQQIEITLSRLKKTITLKVIWKFIKDIFRGVFSKKKEKIPFDLKKVPSDLVIKKLLKRVKKEYPEIYEVLIEERNQVMAKNLNSIITDNPDKKVLAIIGAGHEKEIIKLIHKYRN